MSIKRASYHTVAVANVQRGGAKKTRSTRTSYGREFVDFCLWNEYPMSDIRFIRAEWVEAWIHQLKEIGLSTATINNKVSCIRALARTRGVDMKAVGLENSRSLGLEKRSRAGTKVPVTDEVFDGAIESAMKMGEVGFACALKLERYLGIRGQEALMSTHSLEKFARQAKQITNREGEKIQIKDGTKGGRPRYVQVIGEYAEETFRAILDALECAKDHRGFLIEGKDGSGLKGARAKYHRLAAKVGLVGKFAPHSLRYRYTADKLMELTKDGVPKNEALAIAAELLGHGPSRITFVRTVYGTAVMSSMPSTTSIQDVENLSEKLRLLASN